MKARKYTARTSRDALRQVREELGPDAVILANRMVKGGVEVMAMGADEMAAHAAAFPPPVARPASQPLEVGEDDVVGVVAREPASEGAARRDRARIQEDSSGSPAPEARRSWLPRSLPGVSARRAGFSEPQHDALMEPVPAAAHARREEGILAEPPAPRNDLPFPHLDLAFDPERPPVARVTASERREPAAERREPVFPAYGSPRPAPSLGLKPAPAPLAPPPAAIPRAAGGVAHAAAAGGAAPMSGGPAVMRRRGTRPAGTGDDLAPTAAASAVPGIAMAPAATTFGPVPATPAASAQAAELGALAARHDPLMAALADEVRSLGSMLGQAGPAAPAAAAAAVEAVESGRAAGGDAWMRNMMGELRSMRLLIEDQMGAMAFAEAGRMAPGKSRVVRLLSAAGFSAALIRKVTARLPENVAEAQAVAFVRDALRSNLAVAASESELLDQGGVYALVGPTGAGKTTTAAKLAARFVVRHGAENLALVTTDGYRIGGQEQLRIYGRILGVAVHAVKDAEDLRRTLGELRNRKLVLIDTVGLSQRDRLVAEQHALFANCGTPVKRLLLLNATCHGETLTDVVRAYRGDGLAGCIVTKLDEAAAPGAAIDVAIRQRLRVMYAADGQRVPEDLHLAQADALVMRALQAVPEEDAGAVPEADFPFDMPPVQLHAVTRAGVGEVAHG